MKFRQDSGDGLNSRGRPRRIHVSVAVIQPSLKAAEKLSTACDDLSRFASETFVRFKSASGLENVFGALISASGSDAQGYSQSRFSKLIFASRERVLIILELHAPAPSRVSGRVIA